MSSDKLQNVSQLLNVSSLEMICLTSVKCYIKSSECPREHVDSLSRMLSKSVTFLPKFLSNTMRHALSETQWRTKLSLDDGKPSWW